MASGTEELNFKFCLILIESHMWLVANMLDSTVLAGQLLLLKCSSFLINPVFVSLHPPAPSPQLSSLLLGFLGADRTDKRQDAGLFIFRILSLLFSKPLPAEGLVWRNAVRLPLS